MTNKDMLLRKLEIKGITLYDLYLASGCNRKVYKAFSSNRFTRKFLTFVGEILHEDLSMYINSINDGD